LFNRAYRDKKVVSDNVRFRAPLNIISLLSPYFSHARIGFDLFVCCATLQVRVLQ
jgi:hypothetical protein